MSTGATGFPLVDLISLSRLVAALLFAMLAFQKVPLALPAVLYAVAIISDLVDGYVARRSKTETHFGKVLDLVSDKSLTIVSLLYAAARGISIFPLALVGAREIVMIGARLITVEGTPLLPTSKLFGGIMATLLWGTTLLLLLARGTQGMLELETAQLMYWVCALVFVVNLAGRLYTSAQRIRASWRE